MATLSQLLALPDLGLTLVQAGYGDPEISWSSITELLDLGEYLEGGEIIMTTGLALGADDSRWRDFVAGLSRARISAIGFGVGVNHDHVPHPLVLAASTYRVALFKIPLPVPFIAVGKAVAQLLRADELRATHTALSAQERLLDSARGDRTPAEVLASIAQATGKQFAVVGADGTRIASTAGFPAAQQGAAGGDLEAVPLDSAGTSQLLIAGSAPLTPEGRSVIAAGAMVLSLGLRGGSAANTREREQWERFTAGLLAGAQRPEAGAILDPALHLPARVRAIAVQGGAEDLANWRHRTRTGIDRLIAPAEEPARAQGLAQAWQLCPDSETALGVALDTAAAYRLDAVVGRPAALADASLSRRSATARLSALSTTAPLYAEPRVPQVVWADREAPILEALLIDAETVGSTATESPVSAITERVLGPLSLHSPALDASERDTLRLTLRAVFDADSQRGPAAVALGIHRNTLRDRITRIERMTEHSLARADDRAELWFALQLEDLTARS
ncbi:MAG: PucR family transcriptional regulator ligand-binding domain-containing protein [Leucobacter sp.]